MFSVRVRSKTGCLTCRNRRKKCDETQPYCRRCKRAGMECLGYSHLDNLVPRPHDLTAVSDALVSTNLSHSNLVYPDEVLSDAFSSALESSAWAVMPDFLLPNSLHAENDRFPSHDNTLDGPPNADPLTSYTDPPSVSMASSSIYLDHLASGPLTDEYNLNLNSAGVQFLNTDHARLSITQYPDIYPTGNNSHRSFEELVDSRNLIGSHHCQAVPSIISNIMPRTVLSSSGSATVSTLVNYDDSSSVTSDDSDTEGIFESIRPTLTLDRNVASNFLPFALSSYLRWTIRNVFEPLKTVQLKKDHIIQRYMQSEESRSATVFIANILHLLMKDPTLGVNNFPALMELENRVHWKLAKLKHEQNQSQSVRIRNAQEALYDVYELLHIRGFSAPLSYSIGLLREAALAYQEACHGISVEPSRHTAKLVHPNAFIRHFHMLDVMLSLGTGHPTLLRYDLMPVDEMHRNLPDSERLQWMHGLSDQLILLLARMHALREGSAPTIDSQTIAEIEEEILSFKPTFDNSADSFLTIARMMVQESWRQVLYIYLYMGLCGGTASDTRVKKALKRFVKLLRGVNAGRNPDSFLLVPLIVAGVAAYQQCDRDLIRNRLLGLHECSHSSETPGNNAV